MAQQVVLPPHRICDPLEDPPGTVVRLPIGNLQLADVILSYTEGGDGLLVPSWWVRFLDQGCSRRRARWRPEMSRGNLTLRSLRHERSGVE